MLAKSVTGGARCQLRTSEAWQPVRSQEEELGARVEGEHQPPEPREPQSWERKRVF